MKILYIHNYYLQRGGEDIVYENEVKLMQEAGWEVSSVLFTNKKYTALKFLFSLFNPVSFIRVWRAIDRFKPDLVHVHNWFFAASPSVFIAARWKKVPVVHTIHNFRILCPSSFLVYKNKIFTDCVTKIFPYRAIKRKVYRNSATSTFWLLAATRLHFFLRTWQKIDLLICLTDTAKKVLCDSFLKIKSRQVVVKPNFFDTDGLVKSTINYERTGDFLFVGRLAAEKGIELMLSAFTNNQASLRIIGDGPMREIVERSAEQFGNIRYIGYQNKEKIIEELHKCSALVFTTIGYEQFGMVIIEAFSCGTPVLAPDTGSPAELVTEGVNGLHFRTGSSKDLMKKISQWQSIPDETRHAYSANAISTYKKYFTPKNNLNQLLTIYKTLLHGKNENI
jgi:glycosyltransferase involved in cell wall biosynthesis